MAQLQLLYSEWLDQDPVSWIQVIVQRFGVTCLFTGQYNIKSYGTITDVIANNIVNGWIKILLVGSR